MRGLLILLLVLPIAGCGPDPNAGKIPLRYMAWGNPEQQDLEQKFCDQFNRLHPDIHVTFFRVPGSAYKNKMVVMLASRTAPDVIRVDHYDFPSLVKKQYFLNLDALASADPSFHRSDFFPYAIQEGIYQGHLYGLNVMGGGTIVYFNRTMLEQAGLADPNQLVAEGKWDYDAFVRYAVAMTKRDTSGRPTQFGCLTPIFPYNFVFLWGFGGDYLTKDHRRSALNSPGSIRGLQWLADLRWKYRCSPTPSESANDAFSFESGRVGMIVDWMGLAPRYRKAITTFEWDVCPIPKGPVTGDTVVKGNQLVINRDSPHPKEAWEFVRFMTGTDVEMELYGRMRRNFPSRVAVAHSKEYLDNSKPPRSTHVFVDVIPTARQLPIDDRWAEWTAAMNSELDLLWSGRERDASVVARRAAKAVNDVLSDEEGF